MAQLFVSYTPPRGFIKLRQQVKRDVSGLKVFALSMADVMHQRAQRGLARRRDRRQSLCDARYMNARQNSHGNRFGIAFHARDLSRKKDVRMLLKVEQL